MRLGRLHPREHARRLAQVPWAEIGAAFLDSGAGPGAGAPGALPLPGGGGGPIEVSPSFQQQFTPSISPVFQQIQDSPGAVVGATTTQAGVGEQRATRVPGIPGVPPPIGAGGLPLTPLGSPTFEDRFDFSTLPDATREVRKIATAFDWTPVIWGGVALGIGVLAFTAYTRGPRRARAR